MMFDALDVDKISWLRSELELASAGSYQGGQIQVNIDTSMRQEQVLGARYVGLG
jgi:hypothetical protein